jgi:hypothetical protein
VQRTAAKTAWVITLGILDGGLSLVGSHSARVGMAATADGKGYWLVASDAASSPSATPASSAPPARSASAPRSAAWWGDEPGHGPPRACSTVLSQQASRGNRDHVVQVGSQWGAGLHRGQPLRPALSW